MILCPNCGWELLSPTFLAETVANSADFATCIEENQLLSVMGGVLSAKDIYTRLREGIRIDFATHAHGEHTRNPVVGAVKTRGRGVKITFVGGRSVSLTTGHMLPVEPEWIDEYDSEWDLILRPKARVNVRQQTLVNAGNVRPGMELMDGIVDSVQALGKINAVRLWTFSPALIKTLEGLSIGTRWHEIAVGWSYTQMPQEEFSELEIIKEPVGWLWKHPVRGARRNRGPLDTFYSNDIRERDGDPQSPSQLGEAHIIRLALSKNRLFTFNSALKDQPNLLAKNMLKYRQDSNWFESIDAKLKIDKILPSDKRVIKLLMSGIDVVGEPVFVNYSIAA